MSLLWRYALISLESGHKRHSHSHCKQNAGVGTVETHLVLVSLPWARERADCSHGVETARSVATTRSHDANLGTVYLKGEWSSGKKGTGELEQTTFPEASTKWEAWGWAPGSLSQESSRQKCKVWHEKSWKSQEHMRWNFLSRSR